MESDRSTIQNTRKIDPKPKYNTYFCSGNFENSQLKFKGKSENLEFVKKSHRKSENRKKLRNERFRLSRCGLKKILRKNIDS